MAHAFLLDEEPELAGRWSANGGDTAEARCIVARARKNADVALAALARYVAETPSAGQIATDPSVERCPCGEDTITGCAGRPMKHCGNVGADPSSRPAAGTVRFGWPEPAAAARWGSALVSNLQAIEGLKAEMDIDGTGIVVRYDDLQSLANACVLASGFEGMRAVQEPRPSAAPQSASMVATYRDYWSGDHAPYRNMVVDSDTGNRVAQMTALSGLFDQAGIGDGDEFEFSVRKTGRRPFGDRKVRLVGQGIYELEPDAASGTD